MEDIVIIPLASSPVATVIVPGDLRPRLWDKGHFVDNPVCFQTTSFDHSSSHDAQTNEESGKVKRIQCTYNYVTRHD